MNNLSGRGQLTGIIRSGSGGGDGSEVIINPSGAAIGTMEKISVDGDIYEVRNVPDATSASNGDVLTRSDSGFGWHPPTKELPVFTSSDNGKVLVINDETLTWETIPKELPTIASSDEGKVLGVSNGAPVWTSSGGGGGTIYSTDEREIGTWIDGSKVYQITLSLNNTQIKTDVFTNISNLNINQLISLTGTYNRIANWASPVLEFNYMFNIYETSDYNSVLRYDRNTASIMYNIKLGNNESTSRQYITLQYTKGE